MKKGSPRTTTASELLAVKKTCNRKQQQMYFSMCINMQGSQKLNEAIGAYKSPQNYPKCLDSQRFLQYLHNFNTLLNICMHQNTLYQMCVKKFTIFSQAWSVFDSIKIQILYLYSMRAQYSAQNSIDTQVKIKFVLILFYVVYCVLPFCRFCEN